MVHSSHGFRIYKKRAHILITFGILIAPLLFIFLAGKVSHFSAVMLYRELILSFFRLAAAYFISLFLALVLAIALGRGKLSDFFVPVFDLLQNLPSFALIPVFVLALGRTNVMAVAFAASAMLWPILFYILTAMRTARVDLEEVAAIFGASGFKRVFYYLVPLSFSSIITGSIVGISIGWEAIIGIEIIGLYNGIGFFLNNAGDDHQILTLGIVALLLVVFCINKLVWVPLLKKAQLYAE